MYVAPYLGAYSCRDWDWNRIFLYSRMNIDSNRALVSITQFLKTVIPYCVSTLMFKQINDYDYDDPRRE